MNGIPECQHICCSRDNKTFQEAFYPSVKVGVAAEWATLSTYAPRPCTAVTKQTPAKPDRKDVCIVLYTYISNRPISEWLVQAGPSMLVLVSDLSRLLI